MQGFSPPLANHLTTFSITSSDISHARAYVLLSRARREVKDEMQPSTVEHCPVCQQLTLRGYGVIGTPGIVAKLCVSCGYQWPRPPQPPGLTQGPATTR